MSPRMLIFPLVLAVTLEGLCMQATSQAIQGGRKPAVPVHITNAVVSKRQPPVELNFRLSNGGFAPTILLNQGKVYQYNATEDNSFGAIADLGPEFAEFDPYLPNRDKGKAVIYWKATDVGLYLGYDGSRWKLDTKWESE